MTMRFAPKVIISTATDGGVRLLYAWLDFMRTASPSGPGWTVIKSSNGVEINIDQDNIASYTDLKQYSAGVSQSWFVIEAPGGGPQFMFARYDTATYNWRCYYSPGGLYTGGDKGNTPNASDAVNYGWNRIVYDYQSTAHFGADDASPFGFFVHSHANGNFAQLQGMWAWIPLDSVQTGDTDPYVMIIGDINTGESWTTSHLCNDGYQYFNTHCYSILAGETVSNQTPPMMLRSNERLVIPNGLVVGDAGDDISFPIVFARPVAATTPSGPTGYKGISSFMQWNGTSRAAGETFANRTRVSWGDVNFPWDGSVPESGP